MKSIRNLFIPGILLVLFSCGSDKPVFERFNKFQNSTWDRFNQVLFNVPIESGEGTYSISLLLRPTDKFSYEVLPVYVILKTPSGEERMTDVKVQVKKNGKMLGMQEGKPTQIEVPLWKEISITEKGTCSISIENMVPKIQTEGVSEIGLLVKKNKK